MAITLTKLEPGQRRIGRYGWHPDLPDHRDLLYAAPHTVALALPSSVDLRPGCPPVYDQGQIGSCTANAIAGAFEFDQIKQKLPEFTPSHLFIYYNERVIEHDVPMDNGAQIRDGIKSVATLGVCPETSWPYSDENKDPNPCPTCPYAKKPTKSCYTEAKHHTVKLYQRLTPILSTLKGCLASGYPFSVVTGQDVSRSGLNADRPNQVGNPFLPTNRPKVQMLAEYFNPAAYAVQSVGTFGNVGRNTLIGPGSENVDFSAVKNFPFSERWGALQLRFEFFNFLNRANFGSLASTITATTTVGRITTAANGRIIQLGGKYTF